MGTFALLEPYVIMLIIRLEEFAMICSLGARKRCNMLRSSGTGEFNSSLVILLTSGARSTQTGLC